MNKITESDLYAPVKEYLESLGYETKGEVRDCDITALKDNTLIVVELKTGFTLELIYQALRRRRIADSVYLAVPLPKKGYLAPRYNDMLRLCRQLELGLIFIGFTSNGIAQIDVAVNPASAKPVRKDKKERLAVLTEHKGRTGSVNTGGVTRRKIITVYKEQSLQIAKILSRHDSLRAEEIRELGGCEKTGSILRRNFYHWFEKAEDLKNRNTTYRVTEEGLQALDAYADLLVE